MRYHTPLATYILSFVPISSLSPVIGTIASTAKETHLDNHEDQISIYNSQEVNHQILSRIKYNLMMARSQQAIKHARDMREKGN